jgi:hypothetical protein
VHIGTVCFVIPEVFFAISCAILWQPAKLFLPQCSLWIFSCCFIVLSIFYETAVPVFWCSFFLLSKCVFCHCKFPMLKLTFSLFWLHFLICRWFCWLLSLQAFPPSPSMKASGSTHSSSMPQKYWGKAHATSQPSSHLLRTL